MFGTWVNEEYNGTGDRPGRWVITPDGRELDYVNSSDTEPFGEGWNTIVEAWTYADGNRWYKVRSRGAAYPFGEEQAIQVFAIQRISKGGSVFETVISFTDFPSEITPNPPEGQVYGIWHKQPQIQGSNPGSRAWAIETPAGCAPRRRPLGCVGRAAPAALPGRGGAPGVPGAGCASV